MPDDTRKKRGMSITDELYADLGHMAEEQHCSLNDILEQALMAYRDKNYMERKADVIPEAVLRSIDAALAASEKRIMNRLGSLLSNLAISNYVQGAVVARGLNFGDADLRDLRAEAAAALKEGQRIFNLGDHSTE